MKKSSRNEQAMPPAPSRSAIAALKSMMPEKKEQGQDEAQERKDFVATLNIGDHLCMNRRRQKQKRDR